MRALSMTLAGLALAAWARPAAPPDVRDAAVKGVVTTGGEPVAGAIVKVYGGEPSTVSAADGRFTLTGIGPTGDVFVTAAKPGYYNVRQHLPRANETIHLELHPIPTEDHRDYAWQDPTPDPAREDNCGNCHSRIYGQWAGDAHSQAARNPLVLGMYNGTDLEGHANVGPGYRLDWSDQGNCASCHAPMLAARGTPTDLNKVEGVEATGVSCDFCHKIKAVSADPQFMNFTEMQVLRPAKGQKLIFGPFEDAIFPKDIPDLSYSPLFESSRLCAGCHDAAFWGTPVYETFSEWRQTAYAAAGVQCQQCHMRSTPGMKRIADEEDGGIERHPGMINSHKMMGEPVNELLKSALRMDTTALVKGQVLEVTVNVANTGAGHHVPTGQPMRNVLLLVSPVDGAGRGLRLVSGERIPVWGGDYGGQPGKGFAKVLVTVSEYAKAPAAAEEASNGGNFPAPFWRRNKIMSDNRIPAQAEVRETYWFDLTNARGPVTVTTRLVYRRAFQPLAEIKGWKLADLDLSKNRLNVELRP
jgi:hypothetical protein